MKLQQLLSTLTTANVQVTLTDLDSGAEIATIKASGYSSLDDEIEAREVKQWSIVSASHINIILGEGVDAGNDPDPQDP